MMDELLLVDPGGSWPEASGMARVQFEHSWGVYWLERLVPGVKVSQAVAAAGARYAQAYGKDADFAMVGELPSGAVEFTQVGSMTLVRADWVRVGYAAIGRGGQEVIGAEWRKWKRVELKEVLNG